MNYCALKKSDVANGPGMRISLFVSGCTNHCPGCFQPETWDFDYGAPYTRETEDHIVRLVEPSYISGLTLLGGDPFEPANQRALLPLVQRIKAQMPKKTIWAYTGFTLDKELLVDGSHPRCEVTDDMLACIDVLVDGRFVEDLKNITLLFRGSENQRLIDMNKTRETGEITLWTRK